MYIYVCVCEYALYVYMIELAGWLAGGFRHSSMAVCYCSLPVIYLTCRV